MNEHDINWANRVRDNCDEVASGCWLWRGGKSRNGYAQAGYRGKTRRVHRVMFEIANGVKLDRWIYACHTCDVRHCVNPAHVFTGTPKENQQDMSRKGRAGFQSATHCHAGHEYTPENTRRYPGHGRRNCLTCIRIRCRIRAGWPRELAETLGVTPKGQRPIKGKFPRRKKASEVS